MSEVHITYTQNPLNHQNFHENVQKLKQLFSAAGGYLQSTDSSTQPSLYTFGLTETVWKKIEHTLTHNQLDGLIILPPNA